MSKRKKIVFVVPEITAGGAERVMSFIAKNLSAEDFDVSLWAAGFEKNTVFNVDGMHVKYFNKSRVLNAIPGFLFALLKSRPHVVISSITHLNTAMGLLSYFFPRTKFIGREANVLSIKSQFNEPSTGKKPLIRIPYTKWAYNNLDVILCQSRDMYNDMKSNFNVPDNKMVIINNPITDDFELKPKTENNNKITQFITVARLKKQKGHERIIKALSKLDFPYQYTIVGDGPENEKLFKLINELGIEDKIIHVPHTNKVSDYLSKSDYFLQGSYVEGFPNCLIESCSVGTPVIAYRALGGLNEIMEEGINGFVADNDEDYISNIKKARNYTWDPKAVSQSVIKKFSKDIILNKYEELFHKITSK